MKATWITSAVAGMIFGAVVHALERDGGKADMALVAPLFLVVVFVGVIGVGQIRAMYAERKRRGLGFFGVMAESGDFTRYYFPAWGRMFACFAAVVATSLGLKVWFP